MLRIMWKRNSRSNKDLRLPLFLIVCTTVLNLSNASISLTPVTECPPECPECPDVSKCNESRPDDCQCCHVCVRQHANETCGVGVGVCADSMVCSMVDSFEKIGRCEDKWTESCLKAKCDVVFNPTCSDDSQLVVPKIPPGECCPQKGTCQCDIQKCAQLVPMCKSGMERVRVKEGSNKPGNCCDEFECRIPPRKCENVDCPVYDDLFVDEECPEDSVRPASYVPQGACCPILPECKCKPGICPPARCPDDEALLIIRRGEDRPGRCCDQFKCVKPNHFTSMKPSGVKCTVGNKTYEEGEEFYQETCRPCVCRAGLVHCRDMQCSRVPSDCQWVGVPENECCPVCFGCKDDNGTNRRSGEHWSKDDCTNCSCSEDLRTHCQKHICKSECDNPRKVAGQCCPVCDVPTIIEPPVLCPSPEHCPLRCEHGLLRNQWGCFQCKCAPGIEPTVHSENTHRCVELTDENCDKQCAHGYLKDNHGCPVCKCAKCPPIDQCYKHCLYGFETNSLGCPVCKCRPRSRIDARILIKEKDMQKHVNSCISVVDDNKYVERDSGEWWTDNHCRQCFCQNKLEYCSLISCPSRPETCPESQWITRKGQCCPSCATDALAMEQKHGLTVCHSPGTGRLFVDGETWQLAECISCTCRVSHVLCTAMECPPAACENPIEDTNNKCCRKCPGKESHSLVSSPSMAPGFCTDEFGVAHALESEWRLDECVSCKCTQNGQIECFKEHCSSPATECRGRPLMIKGRCCPVCSDALLSDSVCAHGANVYTINEEFRDGPCRNCSCQPGSHLKCVELQCPSCANPITVPGQCCPICNDKDGNKLYSSFRAGEESTVVIPNHAEDQSMIYMYFLVAAALSILLLTVLAAVVLWSCYNKNMSKKKKPLPPQPTIMVPEKNLIIKPRNTSESESANVSLLSTHSDTSTAPSSNLSSGHTAHSETTPLTSPTLDNKQESSNLV